jgi:hypothetical protein
MVPRFFREVSMGVSLRIIYGLGSVVVTEILINSVKSIAKVSSFGFTHLGLSVLAILVMFELNCY